MKTISIVALGAIFLSACVAQSGVKGLKEKTELFQQSIRWSSLNAASAQMDPHFKADLINHYSTWIANNKMVEYSIIGTQMNETKDKAQIWVEFSYYEIAYEQLKKKREQQTWAFNSKANQWMIQAVE
ncbi:MAG: hypothetical protein R3A45_00130 [Bdellovibrionota bacterium]